MPYGVIVCRSLTYAQRAEHILERAGMFAALTKIPQNQSPEGCSYGVKVRQGEMERALSMLRESGIIARRVLNMSTDGHAEVRE